ncbi:MAG: class I SAM-dependent methyltransferase [Lentisphaeria bacterium]
MPAATDPRLGFFDRLAGTWDQEEPSAAAMTAGLAAHAARLALRPGNALLEVGCGTGKTTGWLAQQVAPGGRVLAVDFAPAMIARAREKALPAEFRCLDICAETPESAAFDLALCFHSFPHFRDQPAALRHLAAALRPGGRLVVMHLSGSARINAFHANLSGAVRHDLLPQGEAAWLPLLAAAGLRLEQLTDQDPLFFLSAQTA